MRVTPRRPASIAAVAVRTSSSPGPAAGSVAGFGTAAPNWISTRLRNLPLRVNVMPTGITVGAAPLRCRAPRARRAAPVLSWRRLGSEWLWPSGKMSSASPWARISKQREKESSFFAVSLPLSWRR